MIGVLGFDFWRGLGIFLFTTASRAAVVPTQPPIQWVPGTLSLGVKRPGREADHSPPSSVEVKEWVELYFDFPIRLHGVVVLICLYCTIWDRWGTGPWKFHCSSTGPLIREVANHCHRIRRNIVPLFSVLLKQEVIMGKSVHPYKQFVNYVVSTCVTDRLSK
jgi:hypothetical protein